MFFLNNLCLPSSLPTLSDLGTLYVLRFYRTYKNTPKQILITRILFTDSENFLWMNKIKHLFILNILRK